MASPMYLVDPVRRRVVAKLIPEQTVEIYDKLIFDSISASGIAIPSEQRKCFGGRVYIYPNDENQALFAFAFAELQFKKGLAQLGMRWQTNPEIESHADIAKKIISLQTLKPVS